MAISEFVSHNSGVIITGIVGLVTTIIGTVIGIRIGQRKPPPKVHVVGANAVAVRLPDRKYRLHVSLHLVSDDTPIHINRTKLNGVDGEANITMRYASERAAISLGGECNEVPSRIKVELFTPERRILKYVVKEITVEGSS
jgi:hypothetical protein